MSMLALVKRSVNTMILKLGDAIRAVQVAGATESTPLPGVDYEPTWTIYDGKGAWEKVRVEDYPNSTIMIQDRTLLLLQCAREVEMHDFIKVDGITFGVHGCKPEYVGDTRILQKVLVRPEPKDIVWVSSVPLQVD